MRNWEYVLYIVCGYLVILFCHHATPFSVDFGATDCDDESTIRNKF